MQLENRSVSEYLLQIQTIMDSIGSIGVTISLDEHLDVVLEGLPREYVSTMSLICSKFEPLSIDEVERLLLSHESRLDKFQKHDSQTILNLTQGFLLLIVLLILLKELQPLITLHMFNLFKWFKIFKVPLMAVLLLRTLMLKPILLKGIIIIQITLIMVTYFLTSTKLVVAMVVEMEEEVMLVEVMVVVVEGLKIFSVKFALNMVMKLHFVIIAMKVIQFDCGGEYKLFSKVPE